MLDFTEMFIFFYEAGLTEPLESCTIIVLALLLPRTGNVELLCTNARKFGFIL